MSDNMYEGGEDAVCGKGCGQEPMGCAGCDFAHGIHVSEDDDFEFDDDSIQYEEDVDPDEYRMEEDSHIDEDFETETPLGEIYEGE